MKRTQSSKRKVGLILLLIVAVLSVLTLSACKDKIENVTGLAIKDGTVPEIAVIGSFNISDVILIVTTGEGDSAQTQEIAASSSMLLTDGAAALRTEGRQTVTLFYQGQTTYFEILVVAEGTQTYSVEFLQADETLIAKRSAVVGESISNPPGAPSVSGKSFVGWRVVGGTAALYPNAADIKGTEDRQVIQVKAEYSEYTQEYNVVFIDYKGQVIEEKKVRHGEQVNPPSYTKPAELASFDWGGVNFPVTVIGDQTFRMSPKYVTVKVTYEYAFESNKSVRYPLNMSEDIQINTNATKTQDVEREIGRRGLTFKEWQTPTTNISTNITLVAIVESTPFSIILDYEGAQANVTATLEPGMQYDLPATVPTKTGMVFTGKWAGNDGKEYQKSFTVSSNLTLKPIYVSQDTPVQYRITFSGLYDENNNGNEVEATVTDNDKKYGDKIDFNVVSGVFEALKAENARYEGYEISQIVFNRRDVTAEITVLDEIKGGGSYHVFTVTAVNPEKEAANAFTYTPDGITITGIADGNDMKILYIPKNETVKKIGDEAFAGRDIVKIVFPDTITEIGNGAFRGAVLHSDITFPALEAFGDEVFMGAQAETEITVSFDAGSKFTSFGADNLTGSKGIVKVVLPASVTEIASAAEKLDAEDESELSDLAEINLDNVKKIGDYAFKNTKLAAVGSLDNVTELGAEAFSGVKLTALDLPKLNAMGENAVSDMAELKTLSIATAPEAGSDGFEFNLMWLAGCSKLETITFGDGVYSVMLYTPFMLQLPAQALADGAVLNLPSVQVINISKSTVKIAYVQDIEDRKNEEADGRVLVVFPSLSAVNVAEGNPVFASDDGVLYNVTTLTEDNDLLDYFGEIGADYAVNDKVAIFTLYPRAKNGNYTVCDTINGADVISVHGMLGYSEIHTLTLNDNFIKLFALLVEAMGADDESVEIGITADDYPIEDFVGIYNIIFNGEFFGEGEQFVKNMTVFRNTFFPARQYYIDNARVDVAALAEENGWENVFATGESTISTYDETYKLAYTVEGNEATVILADKSASTIVIPETLGEKTVVGIASDAFYDYKALRSIRIEAKLKSFDGLCFEGCSNLEEIVVNEFASDAKIVNFDNEVFYKCTPYGRANDLIILGGRLIAYNDVNEDDVITVDKLDGITVIPQAFFLNKTTIKSVALPDSVREIGKNAFEGCSLEAIDSNKVEKIGDGAFAKCPNLRSVELKNVSVLGTGVFADCISLESASIVGAINVSNGGKLPVSTFSGCERLTTVNIPNVRGLDEDASGNSYAFAECRELKDISFVYEYDKIPGNAFRACGVEVLDSELFKSDFTRIVFGYGAFMNCPNLTSVVLTSSVKTIDDRAFFGCDNLKSIQLRGQGGILTTDATVGSKIFPDGDGYKIYVTANDYSNLNAYAALIEKTYPTVRYRMYPGFEAGENNLNMQASNDSIYLSSAPAAPNFAGYVFDDWYYGEEDVKVKVEFPFHVTGNVVLYAKYIDELKGTLEPEDVRFDEENQEFWVISYKHVEDSTVYIPSNFSHEVYGVHPVKVVYSGAFNACAALKQLTLPEGIVELRCGEYVEGEDPDNLSDRVTFNEALTSIKIPASLEVINGYVFTNLANLAEIEFAPNSAFRLVKNVIDADTNTSNPKGAFVGSKWYDELKRLAETGTGVNNGLIIVGGVAIEYIESQDQPRRTIEVPAGVTRLASSLFEGNTNLQEIRFNKGLTSIGDSCFSGAENLFSVMYDGNQFDSSIIEVGVNAFEGTNWYRNQDDLVIVGTIIVQNRDQNGKRVIEIPDYVTEIAAEAFKSTSVRELVFGSGSKLVKIGDYAFENTELKTVTLPASVKELGRGIFKDCNALTFADLSKVNVEVLPAETFYNSAADAGSAEDMEQNPFSYSGLEEIRLHDNVKYFGLGSLKGCRRLSVIVANGLLAGIDEKGNTSADWFWDDQAGLTLGGVKEGDKRVGIRDTLLYTEFGKNASEEPQYLILGKVLLKFVAGAAQLENADWQNVASIPENVEAIAYEAFKGSGAVQVIIPSSVKDICAGAFIDCKTLIEVNIDGTGLTRIGPKAFSGCNNLVNLNMPSSLETIGDYAFENCINLAEAVIPDKVESIGKYAFNNSGLVTVRLGSNLGMIGESAFANCLKLYKAEWDIKQTEFDALNAKLLERVGSYDQLTDYVAGLFGGRVDGEERTVRLRFYVISDLHNYITNQNTDGDVAVQCANAWGHVDSAIFKLEVQGNYPTVSFAKAGTDYEYLSRQTELIESLTDPVRTGYTFMGWYLDSGYGDALKLPYQVDSDITLYPRWYKNDLEEQDQDAINVFLYNVDGKSMVITGVNPDAVAETLYIPTSVNEMKITGIDIRGEVFGVKKLIFTDASLYSGIADNFLRCFPDLEEVEFINENNRSVHMKFEDGVIYSSDGATLIAYLKRYEKSESGEFVLDDDGNKILLRHFDVPDTVEDILPYAFANSGLTSVYIGSGVKRIGVDAFNTAEDLEAYNDMVKKGNADDAIIIKEIKFAEDIYMTEVDKTAFENTAWYAKTTRENWHPITDERSRLVGLMRSAGNVLIAYRSSAQTTTLTIPDQIGGFDITVIASNILVDSDKCSFSVVTLPKMLKKINSEALNGIDITENVLYEGSDLSDIANDVFGATNWYLESSDMLTLGSVILRYDGTAVDIDLSGDNYKHITSIANKAFYGTRARSIKLPTTLQYIGDEAFYNSTTLETIEIPTNVTAIGDRAFGSCSALASVTFRSALNGKLTSIGNEAFANDRALKYIEVPHTVETIGDGAFLNCELLSSVTFDYSVQGEIMATSRLEELGVSAFYGCRSLVEVKIPNGLTEIKETTFAECRTLENVVFDIEKSNVKVIAKEAFAGCRQLGGKLADLTKPDLVTVVTPGKLEVVESGAFKNCERMLGIRFNSRVKEIQGGAFEGCLSLTRIDIDRSTPVAIDEENTFTRASGDSGEQPYYNLRIYVKGSSSTAEGQTVIGAFRKAWGEANAKYLYERNDLPQIVYSRTNQGVDESSDAYGMAIHTDVVVEPTYTFGTVDEPDTVRNWTYLKFETKQVNEDGAYFYGEPAGEVPSHYGARLGEAVRTYSRALVQEGQLILIVDWDKVILKKA